MSRFGNIVAYDTLDESDKNLINEAFEARKLAYTPFSHFKVGSALVSSSGRVHTGCNVENSSFGLTICAERTALVKAVSSGDVNVTTIAVVADHDGTFVAPCGACRQFINEFSKSHNIRVLLANVDKRQVAVTDIRELLPFGFFL